MSLIDSSLKIHYLKILFLPIETTPKVLNRSNKAPKIYPPVKQALME